MIFENTDLNVLVYIDRGEVNLYPTKAPVPC